MFVFYFGTTALVLFLNLGLSVLGYFGVLPLGVYDFLFVVLLLLALAMYRPKIFFWIFIGVLPLETVILSPLEIPMSLRPFQLLGAVLVLATVLLALRGKLAQPLLPARKPKEHNLGRRGYSFWDWVVFSLPFISLVSLVNARDLVLSLKQSIILFSFTLLYWLSRNYLQTTRQKIEALWFFLVGGIPVLLISLYQAIGFKFGWPNFEVMPGRVNGTFAEPDWLGIYLAVLLALLFWIKAACRKSKNDLMVGGWEIRKLLPWLANFYAVFILIVSVLTVARSGWLGLAAVSAGYFFWFIVSLKGDALPVAGYMKKMATEAAILSLIIVSAVLIVRVSALSKFDIFNRAISSVSGMQKITVSCRQGTVVPETIGGIDDLAALGCRHILLEEIPNEEAQGKFVAETLRPDPNVDGRKNIYAQTFQEIRKHPLLGQGLGSAALVLGSDERGAGLNASNIFLEGWLTMGFLGFVALVIMFFYLPVVIFFRFFSLTASFTAAVFITLAMLAITVPNLFNAGLFLGFLWPLLAVVVSLTPASSKCYH